MFNFKKITSVLTSAVMISSTVALAAAANFPAPFVQNGKADVAIVYGGSDAASTDLAAASDIQATLAAELAKQAAGSNAGAGNITVGEGDSVKLEKSSTKFQLGKGILDVISGTLDEDDLEEVLAEGVFTDDDNDEFDYTQKIALSNLSLTMFEDSDYKDDTPVVGMRIASGASVLNYTLEFSDTPMWTDLETTDLTILGKSYYVLDTNAPTNTSLTLLDSATKTTLAEGETSTIDVGSNNYDVSVDFIGSAPEVKFTVNGEASDSLNEGETYKLKDGSYLGVRDILYNSKDTGVSKVEFSIGRGKLVLQDGQAIELNEDNVDGLNSYFTTSSGQLSKIVLEWKTQEDEFVADDSSATLPGFETVKLSYAGMTFPAEETIEVVKGADDYIMLNDFPIKDGEVDINLLYGTNGNFQGIGRASDKITRTSNSSTLLFDDDTDEYFVVSWTDGRDAESYLLRANGFTNDNGINRTDFEYMKDGSWTSAKDNAKATDTVTLGSSEFTVGTIIWNGKNVSVTAGSNTNFYQLYSKEGLRVVLPFEAANSTTNLAVPGSINFSAGGNNPGGHNATTFDLAFAEEDLNENIAAGSRFNATLGWNSASTKQVTVSDVVGESATFTEVGDSDVERSFIYSALATEMMWDKNGDQDSLKATYHGDESYGNVYVTASDVSIGGGSSTLGSVIVMDSETDKISGKNLVVVGGSCINSVASSLLGSSSPVCGSQFTSQAGISAGEFLIQTFSRDGGKVATLVAGYNADDTTNAATYLRTQSVDTAVGTKYKGTTATSADLVVA